MTEPECDIDFVRKITKPYVPKPEHILLTGSKGAFGGQCRLPLSDTNVIVLGAKAKSQTMLCVTHPETLQRYDLLVRDREDFLDTSLAGLGSGRATLAHRGAYCTLLYGDRQEYEDFRETCRDILCHGPYPQHSVTIDRQCDRLKKRISAAAMLHDPFARLLVRMGAAHQIGVLALRVRRAWAGEGKMLGRLLQASLPDFSRKMEQAYVDLANDKDETLQSCLHTIDSIEPIQGPRRPESRTHSIQLEHEGDRSTFRGVFHGVRKDPHICGYYLYKSEHEQRLAAQHWMVWQFRRQTLGVSPDRFEKRPVEYMTAVLAASDYMSNLVLMSLGRNASTIDPPERAAITARTAPMLYDALLDAVEGNPAQLHKENMKTVRSLAREAQNVMKRVGLGYILAV